MVSAGPDFSILRGIIFAGGEGFIHRHARATGSPCVCMIVSMIYLLRRRSPRHSTAKLIWLGVLGLRGIRDSFYFNPVMHGFNARRSSQTCRELVPVYRCSFVAPGVAAFDGMTAVGFHLRCKRRAAGRAGWETWTSLNPRGSSRAL